MRRRRRPPPLRPWTAAEDALLRQMVADGLSCDGWAAMLPGRSFGEIAERRLDLGLKPARLL